MAPSKSSDNVIKFLCDRRFHRQFTITPDSTVGRTEPYRVSYADYGDPTSKAVVLFFGGLMGGRFSYSILHQLAKKHGVRIIHPDRPGIGGSSAVAIEKRIETWLEMVPKLLNHLKIGCVSLASHSFGLVYCLNTLLMYPHLLNKERPYVAFFAPWVHPDHTGIRHLQAAGWLPAGLIGKLASVAKLVNGSINHVTHMSTGLSSITANGIKSSSLRSVAPKSPVALQEGASDECTTGVYNGQWDLDLDNSAVVNELRELIPTFLFAEQVDGVGQDAQMCLRRPRTVPWCSPIIPWDDIDDAVRLLSKTLNEDERLSRHASLWSFSAFHAETDVMVGEKGRVWFDGCWGDRTDSLRSYEYKSQVVQGADHDFILDPAFGASDLWLKRVGDAFAASAGNDVEVNSPQAE